MADPFQYINPDELRHIAINLPPQDLKNFCQSSKRINELLCNNNHFMMNKTLKDFSTRIPKTVPADMTSYGQLYKQLSKPSRTIILDENNHPELIQLIEKIGELGELDSEEEEEAAIIITNYLKDHPINDLLLRGDTIMLIEEPYRNDGKYMWDGDKAVSLNFDIDDYGSVPKNFRFPEFPPNHFTQTIDHNYYIWLSPEKIQEARYNLEFKKKAITFVTGDYGKKYKMIFHRKGSRSKNKDKFMKLLNRGIKNDDKIKFSWNPKKQRIIAENA